jgi:hypothetical protein
MNKLILAMALIAGAATSAYASPSTLSEKAASDLLSAGQRGFTVNPTAIPEDNSLAGKVMRDAPGIRGSGRTAMPTAKPFSGSLSDKAMRDQLGS